MADNVRFEEIDVERINVVTADGKVKLVLSNEERFPGIMVGGKEHKGWRASSHPGMLFYNDRGDECGGLVFQGGPERRTREGWQWAAGQLLFDRYGGDQVVSVGYSYTDGSERYGLTCWDYPERRAVERFFAGRNSKYRAPMRNSSPHMPPFPECFLRA